MPTQEQTANLIYYFTYIPQAWPAWTFLCLWSIVTAWGAWLAFKCGRKALYMTFVPLTGVVEVTGYITRVMVIAKYTYTLVVISFCTLVLAPVITAIVNYAVAGKLVRAVGRPIFHLSPRFIAVAFFASDVLCLTIQASAAGMLTSSTYSQERTGQKIILAGLVLQLAFFTLFGALVHKASNFPEYKDASRVPGLATAWRVIYVTVGLLYIRGIYRVLEFALYFHTSNYIVSKEWLFYACDAIPVISCCIIYCVWPPGLRLPDDERLAELVGPGAKGIGKSADAAAEEDVITSTWDRSAREEAVATAA